MNENEPTKIRLPRRRQQESQQPPPQSRSSPLDTTLTKCATPSCQNGAQGLYCPGCIRQHRQAAGFE